MTAAAMPRSRDRGGEQRRDDLATAIRAIFTSGPPSGCQSIARR